MHCQSGNFGQNSDGSPRGLCNHLHICATVQLDWVLSGFPLGGDGGLVGLAGWQVKSQNSHLLARTGGQSIIGVATLD